MTVNTMLYSAIEIQVETVKVEIIVLIGIFISSHNVVTTNSRSTCHQLRDRKIVFL